ncbi:MAG: DUF885 domain-containing protein [Croceibacterium sp.]
MPRHFASALMAGTILFGLPQAAAAQDAPDTAWIDTSNGYTQQLLELQGQFSPEGASQTGLEQFDGLALDLGPNLSQRFIAAEQGKLAEFQAAQARESNPLVKQDLQILIDSIGQDIEGTQISDRLMLDWYDILQTIFGNLNGVLDDQVTPERRARAKELLERYTGLYPGTTPLTELAKARWADSQGAGKVGPYRGSIEDTLTKTDTYVAGIRELFAKYHIEGAAPALDAMERQFTDYTAWERSTVLTAARPDFRLPPEMYAFRLKAVGIDLPPEQLIARARRGFYETRQQMEALGPVVAAKFGFAVTDYPSVIDELKKTKIPQSDMEARYAEVLGQIQQIAAREHIVTLPDYPVLMRLGSDAENAASPAPHMLPPRLIGNQGERGTFVLTTAVSPVPGQEPNDFNFAAAAWTLSAHEGRPGHELQFARMVETGVSQARALYAFNSVNVEGWALYAEAEMLPYEPVEGQLIALQHRLLRQSRAMLDPMLNLGLTDMATAQHILSDEARFSPSMVKQEVDRYTFRAPGQAGSYFYGYGQLADLRVATELALGDKFDRLAFNDFIVGQGLLPVSLLTKAVQDDFIPAQLAK